MAGSPAWRTTTPWMTTTLSIWRGKQWEASTTGRISRWGPAVIISLFDLRRRGLKWGSMQVFAFCSLLVMCCKNTCMCCLFLGHHRADRSSPLPCRWTLRHRGRQLETKLWCQRGILFLCYLSSALFGTFFLNGENLRELSCSFSCESGSVRLFSPNTLNSINRGFLKGAVRRI